VSELTHLDERGQARMVDVADKAATARHAVASGVIRMQEATLTAIIDGSHRKGDVLAVARVAGIMAAKKTPELVPLCHPIALTKVEIELEPDPALPGVRCQATCATHGPTGVEIEALAAVQVALLTIYDMCKAVDRGMVIDAVGLDEKAGGRSGTWRRAT